ncbi:MAG: hypothetical protein AAF587_03115 [Bacteroidota bacterium]
MSSFSYFEGSISFGVDLKGASASQIKENEPNDKLLMHLKDADYIVQLSGGRYPKTFIFVADSNREYSMDMVNKRAFRFSAHSDMNVDRKGEEEPIPVAEPTGKELEVAGVNCQEYKMNKADAQFLFYVSDRFRINTALYPNRPNAKVSFLAQGLQGRIPLKTIKRQKGLMVITTANKISPRKFDKEQFRIPPNFEVKNRDYRY